MARFVGSTSASNSISNRSMLAWEISVHDNLRAASVGPVGTDKLLHT